MVVSVKGKAKRAKAIPIRGRGGSHIFKTINSPMAVTLSALRTGRPLLQEVPDTHFCQRLSRPQDHNAAGRIRSTGIEPANFRLVV
jgi:hypothetical protein